MLNHERDTSSRRKARAFDVVAHVHEQSLMGMKPT